MNNLVIMKSEQALTTSLKVAEVFKKEHRSVLGSIRKLTAQNHAVEKMFVASTYVNKQGHEQPMYYMNRDGFTLLAMGFTGQDAMKFKIDYINAFNQMDIYIKNQHRQTSLPQTPEQKLALTMQVTNRLVPRVDILEKDVDYLKNKSEINSTQRYQLGKARDTTVVKACDGKKSNFYKQKGAHKVYMRLFYDFKEKFQVPSYASITKEQFNKALEFIKNWYPPFNLKQEIDQVNAQTNLDI